MEPQFGSISHLSLCDWSSGEGGREMGETMTDQSQSQNPLPLAGPWFRHVIKVLTNVRWEEVCGTSLLLRREREKKNYSLLQLNVAEFETDVLIGGRAEEGKARR